MFLDGFRYNKRVQGVEIFLFYWDEMDSEVWSRVWWGLRGGVFSLRHVASGCIVASWGFVEIFTAV